jgi:hypothetical protein
MRRQVPLCLLLVSAALLASGCNATRRELTVVFSAGSSKADHAAALHACTGAAPHTTPEPMPTSTRFTAPDARFRIDSASDKDIARLETCLQKQPGVVGFQDSADST